MVVRRRPVERVSVRDAVVDRLITAMVVLLVVAGAMSILPSQGQKSVARVTCAIFTLGLGRCNAPEVVSSADLGTPTCGLLTALDDVMPEVRTERVHLDDGADLSLQSLRNGDVFVRFAGPPDNQAPFILDGGHRATLSPMPGVTVSAHAIWRLRSGAGVNGLVEIVRESHQHWVQERSALAGMTAVFDRGVPELPPPSILVSRLRLDQAVLPVTAVQTPSSVSATAAPTDRMTVGGVEAYLTTDVTRHQSTVTSPLTGSVAGSPTDGVVRWTRDANGDISGLNVVVVSAGSLAAGQGEPAAGAVDLAYLTVPVNAPDERALAQAWVSSPDGFGLDTSYLLGLQTPPASDQLQSWLTRSAQVTVLRYAGVSVETAVGLVRAGAPLGIRSGWEGARLVAAFGIDPQPNGTLRTIGQDQTCATR